MLGRQTNSSDLLLPSDASANGLGLDEALLKSLPASLE
jgi:hypothetical protein